jgi:tRNA(Ile)-lysidine synthase
VLETQLGPGVAPALARSAELARADADLLDDLAARELAAHGAGGLDCDWLAGLHPALLTRVLRDWLRAAGAVDLSAAGIAAVASLVTDWHGQRWVEVPGVRIRRDGGRLAVRRG